MALEDDLLVPLILIGLALLIVAATAAYAIWDARKNRPRAERGMAHLSNSLKLLPYFARGEFSVLLDESGDLFRKKRYRDCIALTAKAADDLDQLLTVVRDGRAELDSIESKIEAARARGLTIDREAIGLDGAKKFWGVGE
ncbi:MAG: hypothetical protein ISF22_06100 [Methanomassiliicoccus sp.]|nr:hypothetical protein [Methanomassiliicoccus sp.]